MTYRRIAVVLIAPAFALLLTLPARAPAQDPLTQQQRTWRPISQYVAAVLEGDQEICRAFLDDWRTDRARFVAADVSRVDIDKVISIATKSTGNVRRLAILLLGEFHTYRANSTILELMNATSGDEFYACMSGAVQNFSDPRFGPQVLRMFENYVAENNEERLVSMAVVSANMGYGPAGEPVTKEVAALATDGWWKNTARLQLISRLVEALGGLGYTGGADLYNGLLREATPHFFEQEKSRQEKTRQSSLDTMEFDELKAAQADFLLAGSRVADKATVVEYVRILALPGSGASQRGYVGLNMHNLNDAVLKALEYTVPWLAPIDVSDPSYKSFLEDERTLNDFYIAYLRELDEPPIPTGYVLRAAVDRRLEGTTQLLESWLEYKGLPDMMAIKYATMAARLGSWKGPDKLLKIARAGVPPFADQALSQLMLVTCSNCGSDWQAWESLIARMKKDLKRDVYTNSFQPLDAFEKLQSPPPVTSTDSHI